MILRDRFASDKDRIKKGEEHLAEFEKRLQEILYKIPNVPHVDVPAGKGAEDNKNRLRAWSYPNIACRCIASLGLDQKI